MWFDWSLFHCLETQVQPRTLSLPPCGLPSTVSPSGPPSATSPTFTSPSAGQSFRFLSSRCWFFSVCYWLFVVLLVWSNISWICGCWHLSLCVWYTVIMRRSCTSSCFGIKLSRMVDQRINHKTTFPTLYELFLFVMAHLMSSVQMERDCGAAYFVFKVAVE